MIWHILDVRAIWIKEFAAALAKQVPVVGWLPTLSWIGFLRNGEEELPAERNFRMRRFPLQRGFARFPISWMVDEGKRLARRLQRIESNRQDSPVILCSPHYFSLAAHWPGPRIYYATDMFRFGGERRKRIERMEQAICWAVDLVCPNSKRIAQYMTEKLVVPPDKLVVVPNSTRGESVLPHCLDGPFPLPSDLSDLSRPVAGVIGNLAANMDWVLIQEVIEREPWLSWVFVGSTEMPVQEPGQRAARSALQNRRDDRLRFIGYKPYEELRDYARALDVAVLPYRKREPTYSGSSTRFYEHLAACRPIIATRGFEELLDKEPLLCLADNAQEMISELRRLRAMGFQDGYEELRWKKSQNETWEARAFTMRMALAERARTQPR